MKSRILGRILNTLVLEIDSFSVVLLRLGPLAVIIHSEKRAQHLLATVKSSELPPFQPLAVATEN